MTIYGHDLNATTATSCAFATAFDLATRFAPRIARVQSPREATQGLSHQPQLALQLSDLIENG